MVSHLRDELPYLSGKKLLITGGAGFLGHYLTQTILHWNTKNNLNESIQLTVYDNYSRGIPTWLTQFEKNPTLHLIRHDIRDPLPHNIDDFQYIIHAASIASPVYYRMHPIETMDANTHGLRTLLEYCRHQKEKHKPVAGFLYFSSSEIYGDPSPEHIPTPENYPGHVSCTGPRACYDESKRYGETLCVNFARQYDLPIKMVRPFNNYGPGLAITDGRVLSDFARDVLACQDIVMFSDGSPRRTFCYVADAVIGYYKVLVAGRRGEAYNIGVEAPELSIKELAERVARLARGVWGYTGKVVHQRSPEQDYLTDNPNRRCPCIAKARTELGYSPAITLDEGLKRSLLWYHDTAKRVEA